MPSIQIKDAPAATHAVLTDRAARAHQSLQAYLRSRLISEAEQPTLDEVLERAGTRSGSRADLETIVDLIRADRDSR